MTHAVHAVVLAGVQPQAWRNGGGTTRELLAWPDAADWQLRISVADIAQDGLFSAFDGIERWFAVVGGAGVRLHLPGQARTLHVGSAPLCFDGAAAPACSLLDGPTQDLNLMLRRQAGIGGMQVAQAGASWTSAAPWRALFASGAVQCSAQGQTVAALPSAGLLWCAHAAGQAWRIDTLAPAAQAWWLWFQPAP